MVPGPYLTRILAQYGADVVKVENLPKGDPLRDFPNTKLFDLLNAGKRSVAVDLKNLEGAALIRQLAAESDVFVEGFRDGVMDELGLGYAELSEENPDMLYLSLRGLSGKNSARPAHDLNLIAASGCGEWFLEEGSPNYSAPFAGLIGGTFLPLIKLLLHLANPDRRGMHLIANMDEGFRALYMPRAYDFYRAETMGGESKDTFGLHYQIDGTKPHSRYYRCRDGHWVALNALEDEYWNAFCDVVDRPAWKGHKDDASLVPEVEKLFQDAPASYWEALTQNKEICLFRVVPWSDHYSFSQLRAQMGSDPLTWSGFAANPNLKKVPAFGADTFAVLNGIGVSNKQLSDWFNAGLVFQKQ
jgi:alpha-methylacyl-CoA racemase